MTERFAGTDRSQAMYSDARIRIRHHSGESPTQNLLDPAALPQPKCFWDRRGKRTSGVFGSCVEYMLAAIRAGEPVPSSEKEFSFVDRPFFRPHNRTIRIPRERWRQAVRTGARGSGSGEVPHVWPDLVLLQYLVDGHDIH